MTTMTCLDQYNINNEFAAKVKQRTIIIEREEVTGSWCCWYYML
jgi:hypothetical protein